MKPKQTQTQKQKAQERSLNVLEKPLQGSFSFMRWGGARKGAGRKAAKRNGKRVFSTHTKRERFSKSRPLLVTVNLVDGLPSLRIEVLGTAVLRAIEAVNQREDFRVVHLCLLSNHIHLICEADGPEALASAMKGLGGRIAKATNGILGRKGRVIGERYDVQVLKSPQRVRNAVEYVLRNGEKHGVFDPARGAGGVPQVDPWSSAAWFPHWEHRELCLPSFGCWAGVVREPQTYLLRTAFSEEGLSYWSDGPGVEARRDRKRTAPRGADRQAGAKARQWSAGRGRHANRP